MLLNWACHAERLGLRFLLLAMDAEIADAAAGPYRAQLPHVFLGEHAPEGFRGRAIDPHTHNAWRNGQFNAVSAYKLAAVARVLHHGFSVLFSDVDAVLLSDPVEALFGPPGGMLVRGSATTAAGGGGGEAAERRAAARSTGAGVLHPLADFAFQQNVCGWAPGRPWTETKRGEGNTGFYFMRPTRAVLGFMAAAVVRCGAYPALDDQTNLFDEFAANWLAKGRATLCTAAESDALPIHAFAWPDDGAPEARNSAAAVTSGGSSGGIHGSSSGGDGGGVLRTCPLPRLPFASGFAHRSPALWKQVGWLASAY